MNTIFELIGNKVEYWIKQEKEKSQSVAGNLVKYIEKVNKLREPQKKAIEVYLWLKFAGDNQKLADIIKQGLLYDEAIAREYDNFYTFGDNYLTQFLNQFFQENGAKNLQKRLANDPKGEKVNWGQVLDDLLHNYNYSNYLFSLPMGAGKTYLMACFIYLDLYFAGLYKNDKRFAHNFIVLAPQAAKTAILPALQTIKNFNPDWILPEKEARKIKQLIQIEILDALSSKRRDKLQGNNPNLEKVNRLAQASDFGLVFITNAEKVVLERYSEKDKIFTNKKNLFYDEKKASEFIKSNELREKLSKIPFLGVILDEVHHTYGKSNGNGKGEDGQNGEKKLRQAVGILNQHNNVISVAGFSGTPYVRHKVKIGDEEIRLNQIQDIVYNYPLNEGIGRFLKIPEIRSANVKENLFIRQALDEFFKDFDIEYPNGAKSKIAFYCPSIEVLNEKILPAVQDWYKTNRKGKEREIFKYYSNGGKEKQYALSKDSLAVFNNLDKPYSDKRVVLLVAVGTEGWDCRSLTAVVLPRQKTTKNFVLQTTCRCLREVEKAEKEKALIYLEKENYKTLDKELESNYNLTISDLKYDSRDSIAVKIRKLKLGKLKYKQISKRYKIINKKTASPKDKLKAFDFKEIKKIYKFDEGLRKGKIGKGRITEEIEAGKIGVVETSSYNFNDFVYDLAKSSFGRMSEKELLEQCGEELKEIFKSIEKEKSWIAANPNLEMDVIIEHIVSLFMDEIKYASEVISENVEIELLEWQAPNPKLPLYASSGVLAKFMPEMARKGAAIYQRHPEDLEEDFFGAGNNIDPQNMSFNYIPYRMDSDFERNALKEMLRLSELAGLEVYWNGYKDAKLQSFWIQTPRGVYTPDFLFIRRKGSKKYQNRDSKGEIEKILIIETKGSIYYDEEFRQKEQFVKEEFIKHNPHFGYANFIDEKGKNDFSEFVEELKNKIKSL